MNKPLEVVNDGEVRLWRDRCRSVSTRSWASRSARAPLRVTPDGNITSWLDELAFVPIDYNPSAPVDEWSGDYGVGRNSSQQVSGALRSPASRHHPISAWKQLKLVQTLMAQGDYRARKIYQTLGTHFDMASHTADFYDFQHVLVLGRVTPAQAAMISSMARGRSWRSNSRSRVTRRIPRSRRKESGTGRQSLPPASLVNSLRTI